jgi:hypothetical protein
MRYIFIIITVLFFVDSIYSQDQDSLSFNDLIKKEVLDTSSVYYYPKLVWKINKKPTEITISEIFHLYYGQIFQPEYKFIAYMVDDDQVAFRKAVMKSNCSKAINSGIKVISKFPVELTTLLHLKNCMQDHKIEDTIYFISLKYGLLLNAILSTGDGKNFKSAIKVINEEDEYVIKGAIGFLGGKMHGSIIGHHAYDIWEVGDKKLYFETIINVEK